MENNNVNKEKKQEIITREMITKDDGTLDISVVESLLKKGVKLVDLPLKVAFFDRFSSTQCHTTKWIDNMWATNKGWISNYHTYIEEGGSHKRIEERMVLKEMLNDAYTHKFDLIIVKNTSRFSRNALVTIEMSRVLLRSGVVVWFVDDDILTLDFNAELISALMSAIICDECRRTYVVERRGSNCATCELKEFD